MADPYNNKDATRHTLMTLDGLVTTGSLFQVLTQWLYSSLMSFKCLQYSLRLLIKRVLKKLGRCG